MEGISKFSLALKRLVSLSALSLVLLFLVFDLVAATCYYLYLNEVFDSRFFKLGRDRGLFEIIEYLKFGCIIYILYELCKVRHAPLLKAWCILFSVMLVDNLIGLHEEFGGLLAQWLSLPDLGLGRPKDVGEIIMLGLMEGTALLYVIYQYFKSTPELQQFSRTLVYLVVFLAAGSILSDALHLAIEEPFEIIGMTVLVAFVHIQSRNYQKQRSLSSAIG